MSAVIGWAIYAWAQAAEWLLAPLGLAAGWALYRLAARARRRNQARRALLYPHIARTTTELEALYRRSPARRRTRKEHQ